TAY
ncbi:DNA topoisomerase family protein, partial [Vibrio parahaemolyticus AQ3810]